MLTIVDYGLGNIRALEHIFTRLGIAFRRAKAAAELDGATKIILPGVGAFDWAMERLNQSGLRRRLDEAVINQGTPILGICVGMQILTRCSEEGTLPGLGWIDAEVRRFPNVHEGSRLVVPHMGWNEVIPTAQDTLFRNMTDPRFYFLHSYFVDSAHPEHVLGTTRHGLNFASAVRHRNVYGTQFHPEKSHEWGVALLKNFAEL